jgi:very-long-chain enoyl-CoA reductase
VGELKELVYKETGLTVVRQRLLYYGGGKEPVVMNDTKRTISSHNINCDGHAVLTLKDLGPQVDWRTVFLLEYAGPLLLHQLFCLPLFPTLSPVQLAVWAMVSGHYLKRLYESIFVHRFSHATMPWRGVVKNCVHYGGVGGVWMAWTVYWRMAGKGELDALSKLAIVGFIGCELGNLYSHLKLRWLRPNGSTKRAIPTGFPFTHVSCPNYLFELMAWICVAVVIRGCVVGWLFAATGGVQMWLWAVKKHKQYLKEFPEYPRGRSPMFPFTGF